MVLSTWLARYTFQEGLERDQKPCGQLVRCFGEVGRFIVPDAVYEHIRHEARRGLGRRLTDRLVCSVCETTSRRMCPECVSRVG